MIIHYSNVLMEEIYMVCKEALMTATRLDGLTFVVRSGKTSTRYEHYMGKVSVFASR